VFPESEREISRFHVEIEMRSDLYWLRDLTGQGLLLNNRHTYECLLREGDEFILGKWKIIFRVHTQSHHESTLIGCESDTLPIATDGENQAVNRRGRLSFEQNGRRRELNLTHNAIQIGASEEANLCLDEDYVSKFHCRIFWRDGKYYIRDLESLNGTWVNGMRIIESELPDGSQIYLGKFPLQFSYAGGDEHKEKPKKEQNYPGFAGMISRNAAMNKLFSAIQRVAESDMPVFIQGESGVGKELVAKAIHDYGSRKAQPFVAINCGAISRDLIESALFGHEKGAFTGAIQSRIGAFEEAGSGTLFLDEIGDMPLAQQVALLRVLESGSFRRVGGTQERTSQARVITATHRWLPREIQDGRFREDLFFRVSVLQLAIPPLRERPEDVLLIAEYFLNQFASHRVLKLNEDARHKLVSYHWPGNVRELRNAIQRVIVLTEGPQIQAEDIMLQTLSFEKPPMDVPLRSNTEFEGAAPLSLEQTEKQAIIDALHASDGVISNAARMLGIGRSSLYNKMKRFGIAHRSHNQN
jgi:DNA-binding NtrC family response regulator